jgi:hypothetical protein
VVLVVTQDGKFDVCLDDDKACHSCFLFLRMTNLTFISFSAWQSNRLDLFIAEINTGYSNTGSLVTRAIYSWFRKLKGHTDFWLFCHYSSLDNVKYDVMSNIVA